MFDTAYDRLSRAELEDLFHSKSWDRLTPAQRLDACQEMHNRYADAHHMTRCRVTAEEMRGTSFGVYRPAQRSLALNKSVLESGRIVTADGSRMPYPGSNAETLDTLFHETSHAYDHQLKEAVENSQAGKPANTAILKDARGRGIDIDLARASDTVYVPWKQNPDLYRVQDCERRAYQAGETETAACFGGSIARLGPDAGYKGYRERIVARDAYQRSLANLKKVYQDDDFAQTLGEQTKNLYYGEADGPKASGTAASRAAVARDLRQTGGGQLCALRSARGTPYAHYTDKPAQAQQSAGAAQASTPAKSYAGGLKGSASASQTHTAGQSHSGSAGQGRSGSGGQKR